MIQSKKGEGFGLPTSKDLANVHTVDTENELEEIKALAQLRYERATSVFRTNTSTDNYEALNEASLAWQNVQSNVEIKIYDIPH